MESQIRVQVDLYNRIEKALKNFRKSPKDRLASISYLNTRLEALDELWSQFTLTHTQIVQDSDSAALKSTEYVKTDLYDRCEELMTEYKCEIRERISKLQGKDTTVSHSVSYDKNTSASKVEHINLPKISIPFFSGKYSEWTSFRDLFLSLVHNNQSLDGVLKLHYLRSYLTGEADQLLRHIPITQENYILCWTQLEERYDNKKYLTNCVLKKFMSQRNITVESASALRELLDNSNECLYALKNLGVNVESWDIIVIYILCLKLDTETRKHWELKISEPVNELPTYEQFKEFLSVRSRALEFIDPKISKPNVQVKNNINATPHNNPKVHHVTTLSCMYCNEDHRLCYCKKFAKDDTDTRRSFVQSNNLCFNCLGSGHNSFVCRQTSRCRICNKKHHSLLHSKNVAQSTDNNQSVDHGTVSTASSSSQQVVTTNHTTTCFSNSNNQVLLPTALVNAEEKSGSLVTLRCLVDQGSQASFITESAVQLLGLKKAPHKSSIMGLGSSQNSSLASNSRVSFHIQALHDTNFRCTIQAFVLNKLTTMLPEKLIVEPLQLEFANIKLADPSFGTPNKIDVLLGADVYGQILLDGIIRGPPGAPIAQNTKLGWIISGPIHDKNAQTNTIRCNHVRSIDQSEDNELLKKFWELEADTTVADSKKLYTEEEKRCEQIFAATTKRDSTGRYIVSLPFKDDDPKCKYGNSHDIAAKCLFQLEKRLAKDPDLKTKYSAGIAEYLETGHAEIIPEDQHNNPDAVYLSHLAVVREDRDTTKTRIVFNASQRGTNGVSLNDDLLVGPTLQSDLRHIIMRWRSYPICLVADIAKMYRQVLVDQPDTNFQRLLWRNNPNDELQHLRLLRVTFGTSSAPYLAVRSLHQVAYDHGEDYPMAAERVLKEFYMDDLMSGCESVDEGKQIFQQMNDLLKGGGFDLQKWSSNSEELLKEINKDLTGNRETLKLKLDTLMKILGLTWNRTTDEFEYAVQLPPLKKPVTKRRVISDISRLFDPLGWLAPVIISAKIFIQRLWLSGIEWDDELPSQLLKDWLSYRESLNQLTNFRLPRWIQTSADDVVRELQGFCDASNDAYAAVVYLRVIDSNGNIHISLITSKTKVAPIKQISIPRLELCGAVLLTKLLVEVSAVMGFDKANIHAWTDSQIVLAWLNSRPNRWKTFVANRVSEIITSLEPSQWSHVSSKDNPADCASRGTKQLEDEALWKEGPGWLKERKINYKRDHISETQLEEKTNKTCLLNTFKSTDEETDAVEEMIPRFSSLRKLIRVVATCKRFGRLARKEKVDAWITNSEIQKSLKICIKNCQETDFQEELKDLKEKREIKKKSTLTSLNPFVDADDILRVGGRLQHAQISEEMKHPVLIPRKSHFTELLAIPMRMRKLYMAARN